MGTKEEIRQDCSIKFKSLI